MKLKDTKPEIYERLKKHFDIDWDRGIIITYGDNVYCKYQLSEAKIIHEATHCEQHRVYGVEKWWDRYIEDIPFRLSQEVEAYKNEANFIRKTVKDRNLRFQMLRKIYIDLSSPIYGSIVTASEAEKLLK